MNTIVFWVAIYLALCCLISTLCLESAVEAFKPMGSIWCAIGVITVFLIGPLAALYFTIKALVDAAKKKKPKEKTKTSIPKNKEELILAMVRERLELKEGEFFRFDNQSIHNDDIYYFSKSALKKIQWGHVRESSVSLNWILNRECKITKLTPDEVKLYLITYPRATGEKVE